MSANEAPVSDGYVQCRRCGAIVREHRDGLCWRCRVAMGDGRWQPVH